jgi:hypothetical protein
MIAMDALEAGGINVQPGYAGCPTLPSPNPQLIIWLSTIVLQSDLERVVCTTVALNEGSGMNNLLTDPLGLVVAVTNDSLRPRRSLVGVGFSVISTLITISGYSP